MGRLIVFLLFISTLGMITGTVSSCQSVPLKSFDEIHVGMTKDEVIELVGSPKRSEYKDGKDKWAYVFYANPEANKAELKQVTFQSGHVISVGEDVEEIKRIKEISDSDQKRVEKRKA